jgi:DNA-binding FadR family transcriptional regulator
MAQDLVRTTRGVTGGSFVSAVEQDTVERYLQMRFSLMSDTAMLTVDDLLEARELLEVPAARLAAQRATPEQAADLLRAAETSRRQRSGGRVAEHPDSFADREFHEVLVSAAGNRLVSMMNVPTFHVLQSRFRRADMPPEFWAQVDADHLEIAGQVKRGDAEAAAGSMHEHLTRLRRLYLAD